MNMKNITKNEFISKVACFFGGNEFDSIYDLKIATDKSYVIINNTNDLWLNEPQFDAITRLISSQKALYVAQNDSDEVYRLALPTTYDEYYNLDLFSLAFIASENFDWVIAIDEGFECGTGILIGSKEFAEAFYSPYNANTKADELVVQNEIQRMYEFFKDTLDHCGRFLLDLSDEDIEYYIFEEFDCDAVSFLHEKNLNLIRLSGRITQEIVDMSLELSRKFRSLEGTELWNVRAVRDSEKWLKVLELSDRIKLKLTETTVK